VVPRNGSVASPMPRFARPAHHPDVRSFLFVSAFDPDAARRAVLASPLDPDLVVISPSGAARETAGYAVGGRWVFTLNQARLMRSADDLERALPLP
jgi:hypothetical protein